MPSIFRKRGEPEEITPYPALEDDAEATGIEPLKALAQFEKAHKLDPNMPIDELNDVDTALATGNAEKGLEIEQALMEDNSPYPEVRRETPPRPREPVSRWDGQAEGKGQMRNSFKSLT